MPHTVSWRMPDELAEFAEEYKQRIGGSWTDAINRLFMAEKLRQDGDNTKEQHLAHIRGVTDMTFHTVAEMAERFDRVADVVLGERLADAGRDNQ